MAINVNVQHNGEFLPGIILLTQDYYHFVIFFRYSPKEQRGGGGGGGDGELPDFLFCSPVFPVQQTTSGIGHRVK